MDQNNALNTAPATSSPVLPEPQAPVAPATPEPVPAPVAPVAAESQIPATPEPVVPIAPEAPAVAESAPGAAPQFTGESKAATATPIFQPEIKPKKEKKPLPPFVQKFLEIPNLPALVIMAVIIVIVAGVAVVSFATKGSEVAAYTSEISSLKSQNASLQARVDELDELYHPATNSEVISTTYSDESSRLSRTIRIVRRTRMLTMVTTNFCSDDEIGCQPNVWTRSEQLSDEEFTKVSEIYYHRYFEKYRSNWVQALDNITENDMILHTSDSTNWVYNKQYDFNEDGVVTSREYGMAVLDWILEELEGLE